MSSLFSPLTIKNITFKNRLAISPMCQYSSDDGFATDWHMVHLGSRAVGGAALVIQEATAISTQGRITAHDLGLWKDEHIEKLSAIVRFIKDQHCIAGIQLAHAGRKASFEIPWKGGKQVPIANGGWVTEAPSAIPFNAGEESPESLTLDGIQNVIKNFMAAAKRAYIAGYEVVEIHAAHGYLIHQFLSPLSNSRKDQYGGSFENRIRLLLEIVAAIHQEWPAELPLFVRISATDWAEHGWSEEESIKLSGILKSNGVDLIDCSSGGLVPNVKIPTGPGYQVPFAEKIKSTTGVLTGAVGLITDAAQAEAIISERKADLVLMARESLRHPCFPLHAAKVLGGDIEWPVQYARAKP